MSARGFDKVEHRPPPFRPDWLARGREEVIDPARPIIDAHCHLWNRETQRYVLEDIRQDLADGHNVIATVFNECASGYLDDGPLPLRPVGETRYITSLAGPLPLGNGSNCQINAGIVGFADLTLGDEVTAVLAAHVEAGGDRFKGIRHATQQDARGVVKTTRIAQPGVMGTAAFRAGFARLGDFGLSFDSWLYFSQIPELADLARSFPDTPIVLCHLGGPLGLGAYAQERNEVFAAWSRDIRALAACPNVALKIGGMGMALFGFGFHEQPAPPASRDLASLWRPFFETAVDAFGPGRCMFESNFPVDKESYSYRTLWNAFKRLSADCSEAEKQQLFSETARQFYRLGPME